MHTHPTGSVFWRALTDTERKRREGNGGREAGRFLRYFSTLPCDHKPLFWKLRCRQAKPIASYLDSTFERGNAIVSYNQTLPFFFLKHIPAVSLFLVLPQSSFLFKSEGAKLFTIIWYLTGLDIIETHKNKIQKFNVELKFIILLSFPSMLENKNWVNDWFLEIKHTKYYSEKEC